MANSTKIILLVEDEAIIALNEATLLKRHGYSIIHALTGEQSIEVVNANPESIDLILMDIDLGKGIDGTQAAKEILKHYDIPVLFLSSHIEPEMVHKTESITNYGYVVKSSLFTVLDASIKMALKLFEAQKQINQKNMEIEAANEELRVTLQRLQEINSKLTLSEDKFSKAFQVSPDAMAISRLSDGVYIDINSGFTQITEYTREEAIGRSALPDDLRVWVHIEDRNRYMDKLIQEGYIEDFEAEFGGKNGITFIGHASARTIEINQEKFIVSTIKDITDRRRAENALKESERRFRTSFDYSPIGITLASLDGHIFRANKTFSDILGYSLNDILGHNILNLTHPDDQALSIEKSLLMIDRKADNVQFIKRYLHKNGQTIWADVILSLVRDENDQPDYFINNVIDITKRKEVEDELLFKSILLDSAADSIQALDLDGNFVYVNDAVCQRTGYTKKELLGNNIRLLDSPDDKLLVQMHLDNIVRQGSSRFESLQVRKDGSTISVDMNCVLEPTKKLIWVVSRDVTEQRKTEEANKRTQAILKSTMDCQKDVFIVAIDKNFNCLYVNQAYQDIKLKKLGIKIVVGECLLDNLPTDIFLQKAIPYFNRAFEGESIRVIEEYDAFDYFIEAVYNPILSENGEIIGSTAFATDISERKHIEFGDPKSPLAAIRDITDRKRMEEALAESEEKWRSILSASPDGIAVMSNEGKIVFASLKCLTMLGYDTVDEVIGQSLNKFVDSVDQCKAMSYLQSILNGKEKKIADFILRKRDGSRLFTEIKPETIRSGDGKSDNLIVVIRDITDRKRHEQELQESRERYFQLLNAIGEGFCHTDGNGTYRMANPAAERIFGVKAGTLVGRSLYEFLDAEGKAIVDKEKTNRKMGKSLIFTTPIIRADGRRKWLQINASTLANKNGQSPEESVVLRDITKELKAHEKLKSYAKRQEMLMKELEHRVKNSLNIVSSLLSIATQEISDKRAIDVLADTESRIRSMSAVYEHLYLSESVESIDFGAYIDNLATSIFNTYNPDSTRIKLIIQAQHNDIDTKRAITLGLIVNELLTNAIKYAFPDNRSGTIKILLDSSDDDVCLTVSDDGVGLPSPDILETATSMGMMLIRELARQIYGAIDVSNDGGTAVSIGFRLG